VFVDTNGKLLTTEGYGYNPSIPGFLAHLDKVKKLFSDKK